MNKKDVAYAKEHLEGVSDSDWQCGDCGNHYDACVNECPNRHPVRNAAPKQAARRSTPQFGYRVPERTAGGKVIITGPYDTHAQAEAAAGGLPIVELPPAPEENGTKMADFGPVPRPHRIDCPCEDGPCCPWMGDCTCQCMCDFIARIEDRAYAEYDQSENDADEGYRAGYAAAVAEFMSNHGDDATFKLGYKKAMLDVTEKARTEPASAFAMVEELMKNLNEDDS